jgi:hypothetical protein
MTKTISFEYEGKKQDVIELIELYFGGQEFKVSMDSKERLICRKGNLLTNLFTFNPLNWKSTLTISIEDRFIHLTANINTIGQIVMAKEEALWDTFIDNFKSSIQTKKDFNEANKTQTIETVNSNFRYLKHALIGGFIFGIPAIVIGIYSQMPSVAVALSVGGSVGYANYKLAKDK